MTSWRIVGDMRVAVKCPVCKYGVVLLKPGPASTFKHCGLAEPIPEDVLQRLRERRNTLAQVAAAMADGV